MKKDALKKIIFQTTLALCLMVVLLLPSLSVSANGISSSDSFITGAVKNGQFQQEENQIVIYFFWGDGCPHCAEAEPFLEELVASSSNVIIQKYEIWNNEENLNLLKSLAEDFGFEAQSVPSIFIGEKHWEGFNDLVAEEITQALNEYQVSGYVDKSAQTLADFTGNPVSTIVDQSNVVVSSTPEPTAAPETTETSADAKMIKIPLIGSVDISKESLFLSTVLIAIVDGVNPCSIWVLSMLLAITLHSGSRKKVLIIGLVFLTVTAGIYAMFIAGLFTVFKVVSFVGWIQVVVAIVALFFSIINIKDYFFYKEGVSLTIDDKKKPGIYKKIRKVMDAGDSFWGLVGGTIVLAAGVSLVEFSCTAGFPVLWTNLLTAQKVSILTFVLLLLVYMLIYQLDEMGIFLVAVFTLKASKVEEKHGRILKLIGGVLMFTLAIVMLVDPTLMNSLNKSLAIFGIAFLVTLLILLVHRVILPRFGIYLGTEFSKAKSKK